MDLTPPVVSGSGDQTVTTPLGSEGTSVTWIEPTVTDNSGRVTLVSRSHSPGSQFPPGTTTVTYVYSDPSGNTVTYEFDVTVVEGNLFIFYFYLFVFQHKTQIHLIYLTKLFTDCDCKSLSQW